MGIKAAWFSVSKFFSNKTSEKLENMEVINSSKTDRQPYRNGTL